MIAVLQFIFSSFWIWAGTMLLFTILCQTVINLFVAIAAMIQALRN